jgi:hypothetical protein
LICNNKSKISLLAASQSVECKKKTTCIWLDSNVCKVYHSIIILRSSAHQDVEKGLLFHTLAIFHKCMECE